MRVGNKIINVSMETVILELKKYLLKNGINRFKDIYNKSDYIMVSCPFHKDGQEQHASCGILKRDVEDKKAGFIHCFACGYADSFENMISSLMGYNDGGEFGRKWLLDNFINVEQNEREFEIDLSRRNNVNEIKIIPENELKRYRYYHSYWEKRKIPEEICVRFDLGYDKQTRCITMPCWDYMGNCIGVTRRSVDRKQFILPAGVTKPVYLLNFAIKENWKILYLCESQINALYMNSLGYTACACFGTGTKDQAEDIIHSGVRSVVLCFDGDDAGRRGRDKMIKFLSKRILCSYIEVPEGMDVNDLEKEEIEKLIVNQKYI